MTPVYILGHLKHVKGHFGPKIITKIFALFFILLAQIVFLIRKVVNVVGIFNFTTRRVFGAGSHAADCYVAWHVSAGEGELRWERKEFQYCRHKKWNCGKGTRKREKSFFNEPKKLCLLHSLNLAFFVCEGRSDGTVIACLFFRCINVRLQIRVFVSG